MEYCELSEKDFEKNGLAGRNFLQSIEMYRRYKKIGREAKLLGVKNGSEVLAAGLVTISPWHFRKKILRVPGGWLMDYDAENFAEILACLTEGAKKFAHENRAAWIEISPNLEFRSRDLHAKVTPEIDRSEIKKLLEKNGYRYLGERNLPKWIFTLNLTRKTAAEVFENFRQNHRNLTRRAERDGVRVRELAPSELKILKAMTAEAAVRHGFPDPELDYYVSMQEAFGEKVKLMVAEAPVKIVRESDLLQAPREIQKAAKSGRVPLAAAMFVKYNHEMIYLYSGTIRSLQRYNGAYALQWYMIQEAIKGKCTKYNFYGVRPVEGDGVYLFKQGYRGRVEELIGTFALPTSLLGRIALWRQKPREIGEVH